MTQDLCKSNWIALKRATILAIDKIDRETPGSTSEREPEWWLEMMEFQRALRATIKTKPE